MKDATKKDKACMVSTQSIEWNSRQQLKIPITNKGAASATKW